MEKNFYTIIVIIIMGFSSCAHNSDEIPGVTPPPPPPVENLMEDDMLGEWEAYYYSKTVTENPDTKPRPYTPYRDIGYDGQRYEMYKDTDGKYKYKVYNLIGELTLEGTYETIKPDSLILHWDSLGVKGDIVPMREGRVVFDLRKDAGISKWHQTYRRITKNGPDYQVVDRFAYRNTKIAPTSTDGVNPAKAKIDFEFLSRGTGKWVLESSNIYYDGVKRPIESAEATRLIAGTEYTYYKDNKNQERCIFKVKSFATGEWKEEDHEVYMVDDVIALVFRDGDGTIDRDESFNVWIDSYEQKNGEDFYYDVKISRYTNDLSVVKREVWRMKRVQ